MRAQLRRATCALVASVLVSVSPALAQTSRSDPNDLQAWYGASLVLNLPRGWEASVQDSLRTANNASSYQGSYFTGEAAYEFADGISGLGGYRLARVEGATYHRFSFGAEGVADVGPVRLSLRPLLQHQRRNFADNDEQSGDEKTLLRTRLRARLRPTSSLDLYAATEPYFAFGAEYPVDNWRNTIGLKYTVMDDVRFDLFYILRPDYGRSYNRTFHVLGVEVEVSRRLRW
jgi:hypothetical protein